MTLLNFLKEKNTLSNQTLQNKRTYFNKIDKNTNLYQKLISFYHKQVEFNNEPKNYCPAVNILFHELMCPFVGQFELNYTPLILMGAGITAILSPVTLPVMIIYHFVENLWCIFSNSETSFEFLGDLIYTLLYAPALIILGIGILSLTLALVALSLITRPLATLYYTAEYAIQEQFSPKAHA